MIAQNACQTIVDRLEPVRQSNPKGSWRDWIIQAYFQRISLSATGFYKLILFLSFISSKFTICFKLLFTI